MRTTGSGQRLVIAGGLLAFTMLGWNGLMMPALIREIESGFGITDADMGAAYLLHSVTFMIGCLVAGWLPPRTGRRPLLLGAIGMVALGSVVVLLPSWAVFMGGTFLRGFGSGVLEVAIQGLFLYAFVGALQSRAINVVHFSYSIGAAFAPIVLAGIVGSGVPWPVAMALAAVPWLIAGAMLAVAPMDGRVAVGSIPPARLSIGIPLVAAAIAIALYVASEIGVSSWLVRFLADADLGLAAGALTLFWAALAVSRLLASRFGHLVAPEVLATGGFLVAAAAVAGAVVAPTVQLSVLLFGIAGFAYGPVFAGIILFGGRIPGRKDAVTGVLSSAGTFGAVVYPPLMGAISLGPGLGVAMAGVSALSVAGGVMLMVAARALGGVGSAASAGTAEAA